METSLKSAFAQIFSCCPNNLSCRKLGGVGGQQPPSPTGPYAYAGKRNAGERKNVYYTDEYME